ncbi:SHOCT domain-containing protein [Actinacidiphila glaucinigra]|uniref:SHOCT domain-containing protein n=1 Tax=Actinacidiphila glaucinigra TaxID=235986 RepID=UPI0035DDF125
MPGLLRGAVRTAVVAGTATAVSQRVARRQQGRWAQQDYGQAPVQEPAPAPPPAAPPPAAPPPPAPTGDMAGKLEQLKQLGELKEQGILTEEEFQTQKRAILGG